MIFQKRATKCFSTLMSVVLFGGLLLNIGAGGAIAQGNVANSNKNVLSSIENGLLTREAGSDSVFDSKQESSQVVEDPTVDQENLAITAQVEAARPNELTPQEEQLISVTDSVYLQANDSHRATLNVLAAAEQLRNKKRQLPSADAVREVLEKRTANSKHYLMKDGSYQAIISMGQEHFEDENGELQDIVPFLIDETNLDLIKTPVSKEFSNDAEKKKKLVKKDIDRSFYVAPQVPFNLKISKVASEGFTISKASHQVTFIPQGISSVVGTVYGTNEILYKDAWDQTDVYLQVLDHGIKETLLLKDSNAPKKFLYEVHGDLDSNLKSGDLELTSAWLIDAKGVHRNVEQRLTNSNGTQYISYEFDSNDLTYPVTIDPSITINPPIVDTFVEDWPDASTSPQDSYRYLYSGITDNGVGKYSTFIKFDLSSVPTFSIFDATLSMYIYFGENSNSYPFKVQRITSDWSPQNIYYQNTPQVTSDYLSGLSGPYGVSYGTVGGWMNLNITDYVRLWKSGTANYGVKITSDNLGSKKILFSSEESYYVEFRPKLVVNYNTPPSTPKVVTPNGGETVDGIYTITWAASTDENTPQSNLTYKVQYSINNGTSWSDIAQTPPGITSYSFDFSNVSATTTALIKVCSYDSELQSCDQSDAPFTIQHNRAPNAPSGLTPGYTNSTAPTLVAGVTPTLKWSFSDPDAGDTQSAYNVLIYNASNALIRDFGWVNSSSNTFTVPSGILSRGTVYSWKVLVKDSKGAVSPASASMYIKTNALPTLTLTSYADGDTLTINAPTLTWTFKDTDGQTQAAFQVQGSKDNFATIAYNSGTINKADTSHTTTQLSSGIWSFRVMVWDGVEWSAYATRKVELPNNYEPNDSFATAASIQSVDTILSEIGTVGDVDFYKFTTGSAGYYKVTLSSPANLNYDVYVYDANQNLIDAGVQGANVTDNLMFAVNESSVYYIKVIGLNNTYSATAKYGLRVLPLQLSSQTNYAYDNNGNLQSKVTTFSEASSGQPAKYTTYDGSVKTAVNAPNVNVTAGGKNTVEFWMKWDGTNDRMPFSWGTGYDLWIINNSFGFNTGEGNVLGIDASPLKGQWVHVAAVFYNGVPNASNSEIYINGKKQVLTQRIGQTTVSKAASTQAFIGGWGADESHKFKGSIGGLHIWNRALSSFEIQNNLYRVYLGDESGLAYSQP